ncbi:MAG: TetR family transcriptional regulator [Actinomycetaceae bacterium]|nr:TetR family transcriptional regulator [Actinomycetaceae bacterium]
MTQPAAKRKVGRPVGLAGREGGQGPATTREQILEAAREAFLTKGYKGASLRMIAANAGVDVALISYYFGRKEGLFGQVIAVNAIPSHVLHDMFAGPQDQAAANLLDGVMRLWEPKANSEAMRAILLEAMRDPAVRAIVEDYVQEQLVASLAQHLGGRSATRRAAATSSIVIGLVFARYVFHLGPLAKMTPDEVHVTLLPALETALFPRKTAKPISKPAASSQPRMTSQPKVASASGK